MRYKGPAKPVPTWRRSWVDVFEVAVYAAALVVVIFDIFFWRP